ncbi:MAG: hypothetical protein K2Q32_02375 [Alphaproteobacteria bacterium]|nr:hypothetical protein [Alphaproteobacteria bacterium]
MVKVLPDITLKAMAQDDQLSYSGEKALLDESRDHLRDAQTAFSYNEHQSAFDHYAAALKAKPSQIIIDDMFKNAPGIKPTPQNAFLVASYYLAIAEFTNTDEQRHPSLDRTLSAARLAATLKKETDFSRIGEIALCVFHFAPEGNEGKRRRFDAMSLLNQQITAMENHDMVHGTGLAIAFVNAHLVGKVQTITGRVRQESDLMAEGVFNGIIQRILEGRNNSGWRVDRQQIQAWTTTAMPPRFLN